MWKRYGVTLEFEGRFAASIPRTKEEIAKMLEHRMPEKMPEGAVPVEELAEQVAEEVGADEESLPGWATFKHNDAGLYYEGRCLRGHLKDCAQQVSGMVKKDLAAFKAKFANKVYVVEDVIPLGVAEIAGTELRFVHAMTAQGPRNSLKYIDYVEKPTITFTLKVLDDGVITEDHLRMVFDYGCLHGVGQERSTGWGRYKLAALIPLDEPTAVAEK